MQVSKYKVFVPKGDKLRKKSTVIANALALELGNYGLTIDPEIISRVSSHKKKVARGYADKILKNYTVGKLNQPLFHHWENRAEFTLEEFVCQVFGYLFEISGNDLENPQFMERLLDNVHYKKAKKIDLASQEETQEYYKSLFEAKVSLDRKSSRKLIEAAKSIDFKTFPRIKSDEARIAALLGGSESQNLYDLYRDLKCKPSDVLRYAAAKKDFELVKLPSDVKYSNLTWGQRVAGFKFLNTFSLEQICEDMGQNRGVWSKYLKHTHYFGQKGFLGRFRDYSLAAFVSEGNKITSAPETLKLGIKQLLASGEIETTDSGNLAYRTFTSRMMTAVEAKDSAAILELGKKRPGYILRNLTTVVNGIKKTEKSDFFAFVRESLSNASVDVLFSILAIDVGASYRVIDIKGNTVIEEANYSSIISDIQGDIENTLYQKYGQKGQVKVTSALKDEVVPFLSKNAELPRGTKIPVGLDKPYLYFYLHWVEESRRTDLDHSFLVFDSNWNQEVVYFGNQANKYISQSGDITSAPAPNGATEYGKIQLSKIPNKIRYIVPTINVYAGERFDQCKEARAGFFTSESPKFNLNRKHHKYDLTAPAQANIPFIFDVKNRELIVADFNQRNELGHTAHAYEDDLKKLILAMKRKNHITIEKLAKILSGDGSETSLKITNSPKGEAEIAPENLFSLFS